MGLGNSSELGYGIGVRFADNCAYALKGNSSANVQLPSTLFWKYDHSGKDTRRDVTCANFEIKVDNGVTTETMLGNKPFSIYCGKWDVRKFSDDWSAIAKIKNAKFGTGINYVKLRYSQVLLWYAEVMNELNGNPDVATGGCGLTARQALALVHERAYADADKAEARLISMASLQTRTLSSTPSLTRTLWSSLVRVFVSTSWSVGTCLAPRSTR